MLGMQTSRGIEPTMRKKYQSIETDSELIQKLEPEKENIKTVITVLHVLRNTRRAIDNVEKM